MNKSSIKILYLIFPLILSSLSLAEDDPEALKIGFGSCIDETKPQPIWEAVEKENLNDFFFVGDNVYGDLDSGELSNMGPAYEKQEENFPNWLKNLKPLAIWDDHDYGLNDGGVEYTLKKEAQKLFLDFWNIDIKDERHKREGIYFFESRIFCSFPFFMS